jgi:hypothetical protein
MLAQNLYYNSNRFRRVQYEAAKNAVPKPSHRDSCEYVRNRKTRQDVTDMPKNISIVSVFIASNGQDLCRAYQPAPLRRRMKTLMCSSTRLDVVPCNCSLFTKASILQYTSRPTIIQPMTSKHHVGHDLHLSHFTSGPTSSAFCTCQAGEDMSVMT